MTIYYWTNFSKRKNSTKRPSGTGTSKTVVLKEGTSIERPTFVFSSNDFTINYIQAFGHYYFVDDIKSVRNDLIEVSCSMDVLATFKSEIGSYTAFIERCYSYRNNFIPDPAVTMYNATQCIDSVYVTTDFDSVGCYILTILNDLGSNAGFATYYLMSAAYVKDLAAYLNVDWGNSAQDLLEWFQSTFLHTADAVVDCIWLPISMNALPSTNLSYEQLKVGVDAISGCYGYRFTGPVIYNNTIDIPINHVYTDFRRGAPYTTGKLYIFGYGTIDVNPLDFPSDYITVKMAVDCATGDAVSILKDKTSGVDIASLTYNMGVSCPVGHVTQGSAQSTVGGVISTAASIAGAVASSGGQAVASGAAAVSGAANTIAGIMSPTISARGGKGGRAMINAAAYIKLSLIVKSTNDPDDLKVTQGSIFMKSAQINALSGYVKCSNASVPIAGMESEKDAVNNFLNSGFYYE